MIFHQLLQQSDRKGRGQSGFQTLSNFQINGFTQLGAEPNQDIGKAAHTKN